MIAFGGRLTPRKGIPEHPVRIHRAASDARKRVRPCSCRTGAPEGGSRVGARRPGTRAGDRGERHLRRERVGRAEMPAVFCAADIVVQPSHAEGLGLAVLEAMSCGRPVVTTEHRGDAPRGGVAPAIVGALSGRCLLRRSRPLSAELWEDRSRRLKLGARARERVLTISRRAT